MNNLAFAFVFFAFLFSNAFSQEKRPDFIFVKCIDERTKHFYSFGIDSAISLTDAGGRWKSKKRKIGTWAINEKITTTTIDLITTSYQSDTLLHLSFLISEDNIEQWQMIRNQITSDISNDDFMKILKTFKSVPEDREEVLERAEYGIALERICGVDVLVRLPKSLPLD